MGQTLPAIIATMSRDSTMQQFQRYNILHHLIDTILSQSVCFISNCYFPIITMSKILVFNSTVVLCSDPFVISPTINSMIWQHLFPNRDQYLNISTTIPTNKHRLHQWYLHQSTWPRSTAAINLAFMVNNYPCCYYIIVITIVCYF